MASATHGVIPDVVLEEATCCICLKYLTVNPIGISPQGGNTCGRCSRSVKTSQIPSLFEYYGEHPDKFMPLALLGYATSRNYLFPCINRFEGCTTTLSYEHLKQHEEECCSEERECFLCSFQGIGTQLIEHFRRTHIKNLLTPQSNVSINVYRNFERSFLYRASKLLFEIKINFFTDLKLMMVQIQYLPSSRIKKTQVKCSVHVFSVENDSFYTSLSTEMFSLSNSPVNMNFRINDLKIVDLEYISMNILILDVFRIST